MHAFNDLAPVAHKLRIYAQKFKEAIVSYLEFKKGHSDVCLSGVEVLDRADGILNVLEQREAAIATNPRLSSVGRQEEMAKEAEEFHRQLRFVGEAAKDRRSAAEQLRQTFAAVPKAVDSDPVVDYLRSAEIRQRLSGLPQSERMKLVQEGSLSLLRAVLMDPIGMPLVDRAFLERIQNDRAKATGDGKEWVRMESLIFVSERLDQLVVALDLQLLNYRQVPASQGSQPIRTADLAYTDTQAAPEKKPSIDRVPDKVPAVQ